jgi:DNA repair exonuclease SbcCD nuclease subunit
MGFRFVHTADWQIGKAFGQFESSMGVQLRAARLEAIDRIAKIALDRAIGHVVVAGDVFDSELIDDHALRQPMARMAAYSNVTWCLLPGNHDPARGGGVWERLLAFGMPMNIVPLLAASPCRIRPDVVLLPAPLFAKQMADDPTTWMNHAETGEGDLRIGVAHGSVRGFGSLGEASVPIDASRRQSAHLDYLALGDWHGTKAIVPGVWYAGTPERDSFAENEPGHVLIVDIDGSGIEPKIEVVKTGHYNWIERHVALSRIADFEPVEREIANLGAQARKTVFKLILEGAIDVTEAVDLDRKLTELAAHPLSMRVDDRRLTIRAAISDREFLGDPALVAVADRLIERGQDREGIEARIAARAMRRLLTLAAGVARKEAAG